MSHDSTDSYDESNERYDWAELYAFNPALWSEFVAELGTAPTAADLSAFLERCVQSVRCFADVDAALPGLGLSLARLIHLKEEAWAAELAATDKAGAALGDDQAETLTRWRGKHPEMSADTPASKAMVAAIVNLHLRGLEPVERIDCALSLPRGWAAKTVANARIPAGAHEVVVAHLAGDNASEIVRITGVALTTVNRIIVSIGERPRGGQRRVDARARARTILALRAQGHSYVAIADRLGCSIDVVKNVLRRSRRDRYRGPAE